VIGFELSEPESNTEEANTAETAETTNVVEESTEQPEVQETNTV